MVKNNRLDILGNIRKGDFVLDPYPHAVVEGALDADTFAELERTFPADEIIVDGRPVGDTWFDYPAFKAIGDERLTPLWREFFRYHTSTEFFQHLVDLAGELLRAMHPGLESRVGRRLEEFNVGMRPGGRGAPLAAGADVSMECQSYVNYTREQRIVRGPHVDRPSELFAALLYFRRPDDDSTGGDLEICEATRDIYPSHQAVRIDELPAEIDPQSVRTVRTAPYKANTLVLFLNSARAIHALTPRTSTPLTRRHVNFCCDTNFNLFELERPFRLRAKKKLRKKLQAMPLARRLAKHL